MQNDIDENSLNDNDNYDDHVHPNLHLSYEPGDDLDNHIYL